MFYDDLELKKGQTSKILFNYIHSLNFIIKKEFLSNLPLKFLIKDFHIF